jgi:16S rRNA (cytosine967-C5)-methyltransferase
MEEREAAFAARLCYGVLQNMALLDFYVASFSTVRPEKMEPRVLDILRISAYQLVFMDRVPFSAAVNEAVKLTKKYSNPRAAGLVNAVLRRISRATGENALPQPDRSDLIQALSVQYSHPLWLTERFVSLLGADAAERLMAANNAVVPTMLQTNTLRADEASVEAALIAEHADFERHPWLRGCFLLHGGVEDLRTFRDGFVYVQDPAARLSVMSAGLAPEMTVLDTCAAPGGKSFAAAGAMDGRGRIVSCDIHSNKLPRIQSGAKRLGIGIIQTETMDAKTPPAAFCRAFDAVIADVPCSGLGIIRKKPEIRYKSDLSGLPEAQYRILSGAARCVKPGGVVLYSTCTVLPEENDRVVDRFLSSHADYSMEAFTLPAPIGECDGKVQLWPHIHGTDGFFI